jgi:hypothetical protein
MKKFSAGKMTAVVAVAGGAVLASIAPVMADVSAQSPSLGLVRVESPAKLKAWGAAVEVDVTYSCPSSQSQAYVYLSVTQNRPLIGLASGSGSRTVSCTGGFETIKVNVVAQTKAFGSVAPAFAKADLQAYPHSATDERTISLKW